MNIKKVSAVSDNCVLKSNARKQPENVYVQIPIYWQFIICPK